MVVCNVCICFCEFVCLSLCEFVCTVGNIPGLSMLNISEPKVIVCGYGLEYVCVWVYICKAQVLAAKWNTAYKLFFM